MHPDILLCVHCPLFVPVAARYVHVVCMVICVQPKCSQDKRITEVYPHPPKMLNKILFQCYGPQTLCTAALTRHGVVMWDEWEMAAGWRDEQRSTMERVCECGPPIVLILKIPLEQAFFSSSCHSHFDCVAVNHSTNPAWACLTRRCCVNICKVLFYIYLFLISNAVNYYITWKLRKLRVHFI